MIFVDSRATAKQREALLNAFGGKLGGPLAGLIGDIVTVRVVLLEHRVEKSKGTRRAGQVLDAEIVSSINSPFSFFVRYYCKRVGAVWNLGLCHGIFCLGIAAGHVWDRSKQPDLDG